MYGYLQGAYEAPEWGREDWGVHWHQTQQHLRQQRAEQRWKHHERNVRHNWRDSRGLKVAQTKSPGHLKEHLGHWQIARDHRNLEGQNHTREQRYRGANRGCRTLSNPAYHLQKTRHDLNAAWSSKRTLSVGGKAPTDARFLPGRSKIEHFASVPRSRSAAKPRTPRMISYVVFHGLQDARIAATRIFTEKEFAIIKNVKKNKSPHCGDLFYNAAVCVKQVR